MMEAPEWQEGLFTWQKTVTVYANGSTIASEPTCLTDVSGAAAAQEAAGSALEIVNHLSVGGVNLIDNSDSYRLVATGADSYWLAADELEPDTSYTLSVKEVLLELGSAAGVTWKLVDHDSGFVHIAGTLDFTYGRQIRRFTTPTASGNWALYLYAGISGSTTGVTVVFNKAKLEEGTLATSWSASPDDAKTTVSQLAASLEDLDADMESRVMSLVESLGLSEQFASASSFLNAVSEIELIRSELAQQDSDLTLTFNRLQRTEDGLTQLFSSFVFGEDNGAPYLDMSTSESSVKMR